MRDFLGRELQVGDSVVYLSHHRTSSSYHKCKITAFTPKKVYIDGCKCVEPHKLIKYDEQV